MGWAVAGLGAFLSFAIVYQNYIQNTTTKREVEHDLRDKILSQDSGKGKQGEIFSVVITDLRLHECQSYRYKIQRLVTRMFQADTQLSVEFSGPVVDEATLDYVEEILESESGFDISISYMESEEVYRFLIGTIDEGDIVACVYAFQKVVDENLVEGNWDVKYEDGDE